MLQLLRFSNLDMSNCLAVKERGKKEQLFVQELLLGEGITLPFLPFSVSESEKVVFSSDPKYHRLVLRV